MKLLISIIAGLIVALWVACIVGPIVLIPYVHDYIQVTFFIPAYLVWLGFIFGTTAVWAKT